MRTITKILLILIIIACNNESQTISTVPAKSEIHKIFEHSSFKLLKDEKNDQYELIEGNKSVFLFKKEDVTFVNATDYEVKYTQVLLFEFDSSTDSFKYADKDLSKINCRYSWSALTKMPTKKVYTINRGEIAGKKMAPDTWKISVNIDTGHKFGSHSQKQTSGKIKFKQIVKSEPPTTSSW